MCVSLRNLPSPLLPIHTFRISNDCISPFSYCISLSISLFPCPFLSEQYTRSFAHSLPFSVASPSLHVTSAFLFSLLSPTLILSLPLSRLQTDPQLVLYRLNDATQQWEEYSRSDKLVGDQNPQFTKMFDLVYLETTQCAFKVDLYYIDAPDDAPLDRQHYIGSASFPLGDLLASPDMAGQTSLFDKQDKPVVNDQNAQSRLIIRAQILGLAQ